MVIKNANNVYDQKAIIIKMGLVAQIKSKWGTEPK